MRSARLLPAALALLLAAPAAAVEYETFIEVETEDDLYELVVAQQISEETWSSLVQVFRRGVDLNRATREQIYSLPNLSYADVDAILAFRRDAGTINDPAVLVQAGVIDEQKLLAIAGFLLVRDPQKPPLAATWRTRTALTFSPTDDRVPPLAESLRVATPRSFSAGLVGMMTRTEVDGVVFDPNRNALAADPEAVHVRLPKLYLGYDAGWAQVLVGSFRIGFGQRLTLDTTDDYTPNGFVPDDTVQRDTDQSRACNETAGELATSPCAGDAYYRTISPDYRWRQGFRGVAAMLPKVKTAVGHVQAAAFASLETRPIYQYEIRDTRLCPDPSVGGTGCSAPDVFVRADDPLTPVAQIVYQTLPDMFRELTAGGNLSWFQGRRTHIGLTGYGSSIAWLVDGADLDFQDWSRYPYGGGFGAVGVDAAIGHGIFDLGVEAARSFDSTPDHGGFGVIARGTATWGKNEVEVIGRSYGPHHKNPYAGPFSEADEYMGARAADESGVQFKYTGVLEKRWTIRAAFDSWVQPSTKAAKIRTWLRTDYKITDRLTAGFWGQITDKDVSFWETSSVPGSSDCFEVSYRDDPQTGEPIPCAGKQIQVAGRARLDLSKTLSVSLQYQHELVDDPDYLDSMRQDQTVYATVLAKPRADLRLRGRLRLLNESIDDLGNMETSLWGYIDADYRLARKTMLGVRADLYGYIDDRASTDQRSPNPAFSLRAELDVTF